MLKIVIKTLILVLVFEVVGFARDINIDRFIDKAKLEKKHLFVFLHKTDCGYCDSMIEFTLDDDKVKKMIKERFLFVDININDKNLVIYRDFKGSGREFARHVGYDFYPTSLFFDNEKDISYAVPGYRDEKVFDVILKYVDSKSYQKISFRKYKEGFDFEKKW